MIFIKDLVNNENLNALALEMTKTYLISNNYKCTDFADFADAFLMAYSTFKDKIESYNNSDISFEEMANNFHSKYFKETN